MFLINGKNYQLKPTTLKDYKTLVEIFQSIGGVSLDASNEEILLQTGVLLANLFEKGLLEKLLITILVNERNETPASSDIEYITDDTIIAVILSFFEQKKSLIQSLKKSVDALKS